MLYLTVNGYRLPVYPDDFLIGHSKALSITVGYLENKSREEIERPLRISISGVEKAIKITIGMDVGARSKRSEKEVRHKRPRCNIRGSDVVHGPCNYDYKRDMRRINEGPQALWLTNMIYPAGPDEGGSRR